MVRRALESSAGYYRETTDLWLQGWALVRQRRRLRPLDDDNTVRPHRSAPRKSHQVGWRMGSVSIDVENLAPMGCPGPVAESGR